MIEWLNETKRAVTPIEHNNRSLWWEGYSKQKAGQSKPCSCCYVSTLGWTPGVHCCGLGLLLQRSRLEGSICIALHIRLAEVTSDSCGQNEQSAAHRLPTCNPRTRDLQETHTGMGHRALLLLCTFNYSLIDLSPLFIHGISVMGVETAHRWNGRKIHIQDCDLRWKLVGVAGIERLKLRAGVMQREKTLELKYLQ